MAQPSASTERSNRAKLAGYIGRHATYCPVCRHELRTLSEDMCPRCESRLVLKVGLAKPRLAPWVVAMVSASLAAATGLILAMVMIVDRALTPVRDPVGNVLAWVIVLAIPLLPVWVLLRRRFMRLTPVTQWAVSLALSGVLLGCLVAFILIVD